MQRILVIDDDTDICLLLRRFLSKNGYEVAIAQSGQTGLSLLEEFSPDLVMTDFRLGDLDGGQILRKIKERFPEVPVLIITGYSDIKIAIDVMKQGAFDYITKPLFPDEILLTIKKALGGERPEGSMQTTGEKETSVTKSVSKSPRTKSDSSYIFGSGPESKNLYRQIDLVAPTNYSVIIYGESGSGKESIAQEIHKRSKRANGPFVAMDCGAISKELAASEMFGHEKGSFTGALNQKIGHFEMANGGTLFLDEVANLPYDVQVALLRVVQERKLRRIGGNKEISVDVRILVASNERLMESCRKGKFREDLYHRFNEFSLDVPPLRDRKTDIMEFAQFFLETTNAELGKDVKGFDEDVKAAFLSYPWYGNLREMRNVVKRSTLLSDGDYIESKSLPFEIINYSRLLFSEPTQPIITEDIAPKQEEPVKPNLKSAALDAEYEMILQVLKQVNYNKSKAAQVLSIDRKTLYNKMKSYNL
ncbi:sigma-54 dependent transcriptional regulator [Emticicia sp. BO119]|uniref:sigma-54-dependent transcriptional regulator n=1 Tax=Emticicia sp. BO119 TaxID=2757768 RepID=UPI0015F07797|nr:sigma-54 dependent transcriptional regulator [Emticicia sp. BO119]MBA4854001.1 sigma-54-dependent Fis family transcriptional regulator [Emticicia sp. BO119]